MRTNFEVSWLVPKMSCSPKNLTRLSCRCRTARRCASRASCDKQRWTLSVINWRRLSVEPRCNKKHNVSTSQTRRRIFAHDGSNEADSRKDVPFGVSLILLPIREQNPTNSQFRGCEWRFRAKLSRSKNMHIIKTPAPIPTKFCTVIKTIPNSLRGWAEHVHNKSKMVDVRRLAKIEKSSYLLNGSTDFD